MGSDAVTIAIDTTGDAFSEILEAVAIQSKRRKTARNFILIGDEIQITNALDDLAHNAEKIAVVHQPHAPIGALRGGIDTKGSALEFAMQMVTRGDADGLVTAAAKIVAVHAAEEVATRTDECVTALATYVPTSNDAENRFCLLLDVGAHPEAQETDLIQYAIQGAAFAEKMFDRKAPRVRLLAEPANVPLRVLKAAESLVEHPEINFEGYIDGHNIPLGKADVIVCDGFTGALVLSVLDGAIDALMNVAKTAYDERWRWRFGLRLLSGGLERVRDVTNVSAGSVLLGVDQTITIAEPNATAQEFASVINLAVEHVRRHRS